MCILPSPTVMDLKAGPSPRTPGTCDSILCRLLSGAFGGGVTGEKGVARSTVVKSGLSTLTEGEGDRVGLIVDCASSSPKGKFCIPTSLEGLEE